MVFNVHGRQRPTRIFVLAAAERDVEATATGNRFHEHSVPTQYLKLSVCATVQEKVLTLVDAVVRRTPLEWRDLLDVLVGIVRMLDERLQDLERRLHRQVSA
ncbi:hypothetical protein H310_03597 [Aphanomyces invadans]|uniref:Uncharacterized protein n=1 Tax=Aphanomyces invadans TaxID=157072 RepID=A0A024UK52_9STRA|nr:hypothetical protein H310_03597 [Aphanomyces invadans]ETW05973.1 hypothetical protein H310_03597 [Aphanomyces invadans]|eukprot:XP_008865750.1 hypothetical protein H310_03597 [Aphanomyces invadans]